MRYQGVACPDFRLLLGKGTAAAGPGKLASPVPPPLSGFSQQKKKPEGFFIVNLIYRIKSL